MIQSSAMDVKVVAFESCELKKVDFVREKWNHEKALVPEPQSALGFPTSLHVTPI